MDRVANDSRKRNAITLAMLTLVIGIPALMIIWVITGDELPGLTAGGSIEALKESKTILPIVVQGQSTERPAIVNVTSADFKSISPSIGLDCLIYLPTGSMWCERKTGALDRVEQVYEDRINGIRCFRYSNDFSCVKDGSTK